MIDDALRREFEIGGSEGPEGLSLSLMRPALNVRGIQSGQIGAAAANAIPTTASISIDFRLVPDQSPRAVRAAVEAFLRAKGWTIVAPNRMRPYAVRTAASCASIGSQAIRHCAPISPRPRPKRFSRPRAKPRAVRSRACR
jgi:acetylornithine deacetylase/succinyl-diaminopimelate desuccinylase-like protein